MRCLFLSSIFISETSFVNSWARSLVSYGIERVKSEYFALKLGAICIVMTVP